MRVIHKDLKIGAYRSCKGFLWWPKSLKNVAGDATIYRWLEKAEWKEKVIKSTWGGGYWAPYRWEDI